MAERLTPALLRRHARASNNIAWESQARQLLNWAADALEAAEEALRDTATKNTASTGADKA